MTTSRRQARAKHSSARHAGTGKAGPRRATASPPDSLLSEDENLPDDPRRNDSPDTIPDSLPQSDGDRLPTSSMSDDGGLAEHPIHDDDLEDLDPEDYERDIDAQTAQGDLVSIMRRRQ